MSEERQFDPHAYTITVRRLLVDDELQYVAKVSELPHIAVYESTFQAAYEVAVDSVMALHDAAQKHGRPFPEPNAESLATGRFTLRMPSWLHAKLQQLAENDGQSLNNHICGVLIAHQTVVSLTEHAKHILADSMSWQAETTTFPAAVDTVMMPRSLSALGAEYAAMATPFRSITVGRGQR
jgi:predicted HicB family RNase H-like nuclease